MNEPPSRKGLLGFGNPSLIRVFGASYLINSLVLVSTRPLFTPASRSQFVPLRATLTEFLDPPSYMTYVVCVVLMNYRYLYCLCTQPIYVYESSLPKGLTTKLLYFPNVSPQSHVQIYASG